MQEMAFCPHIRSLGLVFGGNLKDHTITNFGWNNPWLDQGQSKVGSRNPVVLENRLAGFWTLKWVPLVVIWTISWIAPLLSGSLLGQYMRKPQKYPPCEHLAS